MNARPGPEEGADTDPPVSAGREGGVVHIRAARVHEDTGARHEAAAVAREVRANAQQAEFERLSSEITRRAAQLGDDAVDLDRRRTTLRREHPRGDRHRDPTPGRGGGGPWWWRMGATLEDCVRPRTGGVLTDHAAGHRHAADHHGMAADDHDRAARCWEGHQDPERAGKLEDPEFSQADLDAALAALPDAPALV